MRGRECIAGLLAASMLAGISTASPDGEPATSEEPAEAKLALGVAPFATQGPPGAAVPDVASLLAARLEAGGVGRVVGPREFAGPAAAEGLDAVVGGRTTRIGAAISLDVRLRDPNGAIVDTFVEEVPRPVALEAAVGRLADRVVAAALELRNESEQPAVASLPAPAAVAPAAARPASSGGVARAGPFGFSSWKSDGSLSIHSEDLEAIQKQGARTLVFRKKVRVVQGELSITCGRLEAYYPAKASEPDRLVATGNVHLVQGTQEAWCDETIYDRRAETLVCRGNARFRDGDNTLRGREIHIDLEKETVNVRGGAEVVIQPDDPSSGGDS